MLEANAGFYFPYTPATNMLRGLQETLAMLDEEGLPNVFARHARHAAAARAAVEAWGKSGAVELQCQAPADYSSSLTAVRLGEGHSADSLRALILRRFNMSLGNGLGMLKDRVFRIGHLGDLSELSLIGTLSGVEMGLRLAGVPCGTGGVEIAMSVLTG
jgi:alanine-glyoxylate transaminase/serine-glyoxylate transaminase/serine-pyruvate transaminase